LTELVRSILTPCCSNSWHTSTFPAWGRFYETVLSRNLQKYIKRVNYMSVTIIVF
jgi:2-phosphoglycerate kinase